MYGGIETQILCVYGDTLCMGVQRDTYSVCVCAETHCVRRVYKETDTLCVCVCARARARLCVAGMCLYTKSYIIKSISNMYYIKHSVHNIYKRIRRASKRV